MQHNLMVPGVLPGSSGGFCPASNATPFGHHFILRSYEFPSTYAHTSPLFLKKLLTKDANKKRNGKRAQNS